MKNCQMCSILLVVPLFLEPVEPIVEGVLVEFEKFPYIVRIERALAGAYEYVCTGAVLKPTWTVTAGQCTAGIGKLAAVIRLGNDTSNIQGSGFSAPILEVITHPGYYKMPDALKPVNRRQISRAVQFRNDIGLVRHSAITLEAYGRLSAAHQDSQISKSCQVFGYGLSNVTDEDALGTVWAAPADGRLRALRLRLARCVPPAPVVFPSLCGSTTCNESGAACYGDEGGPVLCADRLVAVVTAGLNTCDLISYPSVGVFTAVSSYIRWILEQVKKTRNISESNGIQNRRFGASGTVSSAEHNEGMKKENLVKTRPLLPSNFKKDNLYEKRNRKLLEDIYLYYDAYK